MVYVKWNTDEIIVMKNLSGRHHLKGLGIGERVLKNGMAWTDFVCSGGGQWWAPVNMLMPLKHL